MTPRLPQSLLIVTVVALLFSGCKRPAPDHYQGYIEGEFVYAAVPLGGTLEELNVQRGAEVAEGQLLFILEHESETAALLGAQSLLREAESRLADLQKGQRPSEIAALEASIQEARTRLALAALQLERRRKLSGSHGGSISEEELDRMASEVAADEARVTGLEAQMETAKLGARPDAIAATKQQIASQQSLVSQAQWAVDQKSAHSPAAAAVHDTLYRVGEWIAPGKPVVALLPPANIKVRFFVPQPELARIKLDQPIRVEIDGAPPLEARVTYLSTRAEFTPPVIYSQEESAKLVYMIEGAFPPETAATLKPGQPARVFLAAP